MWNIRVEEEAAQVGSESKGLTKGYTNPGLFYFYHKGNCLCAVTGRSGKGTHTRLFFRFCSLSSSNRTLVASSFNTTVMPACALAATTDADHHQSSQDDTY